MAKVEEVSAGVSAAKAEHQKELGDVRGLVQGVQAAAQREREGILASLVEAQGDIEAVRESVALSEQRKCGWAGGRRRGGGLETGGRGWR